MADDAHTPLALRPLGDSSLLVSAIGLGTVKLGRTAGLKYAGACPATLPTNTQLADLLIAAKSCGINLVDTAPAYGTAETRLGEHLWKVWRRDELVLCTKAGERFDTGAAASTYDFSPPALSASIHRSLKALRTEHLDIALLHFASVTDDLAILKHGEALAALAELRRSGHIRAIGISAATLAGALWAIDHRSQAAPCDVLMLTLNAAESAMLPAIAAARAAGIGVLIKKPLASGHATFASCAPHPVQPVIATPGVTSAIIGTTNPAHLRAAANACR